jgi:hypothetical protein
MTARFSELVGARLVFNYDLTAPDGLSTAEKEAREQEAYAASESWRGDYTRAMFALLVPLVDEARWNASPTGLDALLDHARTLDAELATQLATIGVVGFHEMEMPDGNRLRLPEYFATVIATLRRDIALWASSAAAGFKRVH